jgi:2'-5' RNA ligase
MDVTIVAVPADDEYVWEASSEKVPHLTLLFLQDVENLESVVEHVRHTVDTTMSKFGMDVERRGVLGSESADVLFFGNHNKERLLQFRHHLLTNADIQDGYNAAEQYPEWIPHLTLGYPATPAKMEPHTPMRISWVNFDRIAVWTGQYEGVDFPLKSNELSMTDRGAEALAHYGVKGMKWGVIRDRARTGGKKAARAGADYVKPSKDAIRTKQLKTKAKVAGVDSLTNRDLQTVIQRMNLEVQYTQLKQAQFAETYIGKGKRIVGGFLKDLLKDAVVTTATGGASAGSYSWGNGKKISVRQPIDARTPRRAIGS